MTDRLWGIADLTCRDCRGLVGVESAELSPDDSNLSGKSALLCLSCGLRRPVRDLPLEQQGPIVERLRRLLIEDEFAPVADALAGFLEGRPGTPGVGGNLRHPQDMGSQPPDPTEVVRDVAVSTAPPAEAPLTGATREVTKKSAVISTRTESPYREKAVDFAVITKLGREEVQLLAASLSSPVGEEIPNKRSRSSFSVTRLRTPRYDLNLEIEVYAELKRKKSNGRYLNWGFSIHEVKAFGTMLTERSHETKVFVVDGQGLSVGLLTVERTPRGAIGALTVARRRKLPDFVRV